MNKKVVSSIKRSGLLTWQNYVTLAIVMIGVIPLLNVAVGSYRYMYYNYMPISHFIEYRAVTPDKSAYQYDEDIIGVSYKYQRGGYTHSFVSRLLCDEGKGFTEYSRKEWPPYVVKEADYRETGKRWRYDKAKPREATCYIRSTVCLHLPKLLQPRCFTTEDTPWFEIVKSDDPVL